MIDIIVLRELFAEQFGTVESGTEPRVARFDSLSDAEQERVYRDLKASRHELLWALQTQLPQLKRDGWEPLIKRDGKERPTIFMDRLGSLILLHRPPPRLPEAA
jgi:hypothetical protein